MNPVVKGTLSEDLVGALPGLKAVLAEDVAKASGKQ